MLKVWDMLPGGVTVVGLCLVSPSFQPTAVTALTRLARRLSQTYKSTSSALHQFLIMHFSTVTAK